MVRILLIFPISFFILTCSKEGPHTSDASIHDISIYSPEVGDKFTFGLPLGEVSDTDIEITVDGSPAQGQEQYSSQMVWEVTYRTGWTPVTGETGTLMRSGLYVNNSDFGDHNIQVSYTDSEQHDHVGSITVQVFFKKYDNTNPGIGDPNWYYYWSRTTANKGDHIYGGYNGNIDGGYYEGDNLFYIYSHASESSVVGGGYRSNRPSGIVVSGIDLFAVVCLLEDLHQTHYFDWVATGLTDSDGDWVPDAVEDANGNGIWNWTDVNGNGQYDDGEGETRVDRRDTDRDGADDEEELAWDIEFSWIIGLADSLDWSNPGKNIP